MKHEISALHSISSISNGYQSLQVAGLIYGGTMSLLSILTFHLKGNSLGGFHIFSSMKILSDRISKNHEQYLMTLLAIELYAVHFDSRKKSMCHPT